MKTKRLLYNPEKVRQEFYKKHCGVLDKFKISLYPISTGEVNCLTTDIVQDCFWAAMDNKDNFGYDFTNESEYLLFVALRSKYGFNYLNEKKKEIEPDPVLKKEEPKRYLTQDGLDAGLGNLYSVLRADIEKIIAEELQKSKENENNYKEMLF